MAEPPQSPPADAKSERERRLAAALRENLRRRKAQARGRRESDTNDVKDATDSRRETAPREEGR